MKLPSLIANYIAPPPDQLPIGDQPMLDEARAQEVASIQQEIASIEKRIHLVAMVDSAALSAAVLPGLERDLKNAKARLIERLNSYGAANG